MSQYYDNMSLAKGDRLLCIGNISAPWFTMKKVYVVDKRLKLVDDNNKRVKHPSARFIHIKD
jgi:hypothetical protein